MSRFLHILIALLLMTPIVTAAQTAGPVTPSESDLQALVTPPVGTPEHEERAPRATAVAAEGEIEIDGVLDEPTWRNAPAVDRFIQFDPVSGAPAAQKTTVRFAYDDENFYIGARMYDDLGERGVIGRLARRDANPPGDYLQFVFDTVFDHLGRTVFLITPAGARNESYGPGGSNTDSSWNPIYRAQTTVDSLGWTLEMAIPFSQLRYARGEEIVWGMQIWRYVERLNETQMWSYWRRDDQGGPPRFGHLTGIVPPATRGDRLEVLPYVVAL